MTTSRRSAVAVAPQEESAIQDQSEQARRRSTGFCWLTLGVCLLSHAVLPAVAEAKGKSQATASEQLSFGVKMAQRGLWGEALFRFEQAARLAPNDPKVLNNLAVAYEALGRFDLALEAYQKAVRSSSNRELRGNYTRFVEFYQSFKAEETKEDEASAGEGVGEESEGESAMESQPS